VLEMHGESSVGGDHRPAIVPNNDLLAAGVHHGLDREDEARPELGVTPKGPIDEVRDVRIFVKLLSDAVAEEALHDVESAPFDVLLDRPADVGDAAADPAGLDAAIESHTSHLEERLRFGRDLAHGEGPGRIAAIAAVPHADIDAHQI